MGYVACKKANDTLYIVYVAPKLYPFSAISAAMTGIWHNTDNSHHTTVQRATLTVV